MSNDEKSNRGNVPWRGLLIAMGLGFVVYAALGLVSDLGRVAVALEDYAPWTFFAALALAFTNYLIRFLKWQYYLRLLEIRIPAGHSFVVFLAGFLMSVTPAKVGEVLRSVLLAESSGIPVEQTAPIVVADRLSDLLALIILMGAGAATFREGWLVMVVGLAMCFFVLAAIQFEPLGRWLLNIARRLPLVGRAGDRFSEAYQSLRKVGSAKVMALPLLLSLIGWFCECLAFHVIVRGFPGALSGVFTNTFIYALSTVAGAVAMLPGGLGATEASMAGLLTILRSGLDPGAAAAATVLVRLATLWFAVVVGLVAFGLFRLSLRGKKE